MHTPKRLDLKLTLLVVLLLVAFSYGIGVAQEGGEAEEVDEPSGSPFHPTFPLLDEMGENVLDSGAPVSTMETCGACHDTAFIAEHSYHADVGLSELTGTGEAPTGRPWDTGPGLFGKWDPLTYRYLSPAGDERVDLTTPEWIQLMGARHVGGGPAVLSREGEALEALWGAAAGVQTQAVDPETGEMVPWNWEESGTVEMNCFLCHMGNPDNEARIAALEAGEFRWANTATLGASGIVEAEGEGWTWNEAAFNEDGELADAYVSVQDPTDENCGQCHGTVHTDVQTPLVLEACDDDEWSTLTTGQVFSPQRIARSGLNLTDKETLARSWDIHAERVVGCTDCHYSLNNPIYYEETGELRPDHLEFDPRRIDLGEYLERPLHQFAKGDSAQTFTAHEFDGSLRRCESCHSIDATHDWLPYKERHTTALSCESCHVPKLYAPAQQMVDWTVLEEDGSAVTACRGIADQGTTPGTTLIEGYEPVLLPRTDADGTSKLAPYNMITSWYWVYGAEGNERPVPLRDLQAAWLEDGAYPDEIVATFDTDGNGRLEEVELLLDSEAKSTLIASRLEALDLENPRITGEVQPYNIAHNVAEGEWATKECRTCHSEDSRVTQPLLLAERTPGGVLPVLVSESSTQLRGEVVSDDDGTLTYQPTTKGNRETGVPSRYLLGHDSLAWVDLLGGLLFLGTIAGAGIHGGLRYFAARRQAPHDPETRDVYMYGVYERLWHWLQTVVIFGLLFTGLVIHKPDTFGIFSFRYVVEVHNVLAAILVINAALSAFYHLASGEIQQFLPRPRGFFDQAFEQAKFYLQGIFRGDEHPFEKTQQRKMNPLQQMTYFGLLNVLLPLQIITGALMWGVQRWPDIAMRLGGLPGLAPFHTLIAWLFASFIVMHVYLTTTGHTVTANIRAMIMGWDEVEVHEHGPETGQADIHGQAQPGEV